MKPNNVIYLKCTEDSFFRMWIEFLTPFHKLASREKDVAARLLIQYFRLKDSVKDPEVLRDILWSRKSREDIMRSLQMSQPQFLGIIGKLKSRGVIMDGDINPKYIPHCVPDDPRFMLQIVYDWSSANNPIKRDAQ